MTPVSADSYRIYFWGLVRLAVVEIHFHSFLVMERVRMAWDGRGNYLGYTHFFIDIFCSIARSRSLYIP